MIWPFRKTKRARTQEAEIQQRIDAADAKLTEVQRRWGAVNSIREALVTRRLENGFGEELAVAWTPRGRT